MFEAIPFVAAMTGLAATIISFLGNVSPWAAIGLIVLGALTVILCERLSNNR